jgi:hypothetical protein
MIDAAERASTPTLPAGASDMPHLVLLVDSIFDNASYVAPGSAVIDQLRNALPAGWTASLLAVDRSLVSDVHRQIDALPRDATHLFLSCRGNNALDHLFVLAQRVHTLSREFEPSAQSISNEVAQADRDAGNAGWPEQR